MQEKKNKHDRMDEQYVRARTFINLLGISEGNVSKTLDDVPKCNQRIRRRTARAQHDAIKLERLHAISTRLIKPHLPALEVAYISASKTLRDLLQLHNCTETNI